MTLNHPILPSLLCISEVSGEFEKEPTTDHPSVRKPNLVWSQEEVEVLFSKHIELGNQWTNISKFFQNKTENIIKNFFYSSLRKIIRKIKTCIMPAFNNGSLTFGQVSHLLDYLQSVVQSLSGKHYRRKKTEALLKETLKSHQISVEKIVQYRKKMEDYYFTRRIPMHIDSSILRESTELRTMHELIQSKFLAMTNLSVNQINAGSSKFKLPQPLWDPFSEALLKQMNN